MPVRTTVVGSWWLHPDMEEELAHHHAGQLPPKESEAHSKSGSGQGYCRTA